MKTLLFILTAAIACSGTIPLVTWSVTSPPSGHSLTAAACNGKTDDQPAIQGQLDYAKTLASSSTQYILTLPSGCVALMNSWFWNGNALRNLQLYSHETLETAPGYSTKAEILQGGACPAHRSSRCGGRPYITDNGQKFTWAFVIGIGSGGQDARNGTQYNVSSATAGNSYIVLSTSSDTSHFNVGDDIWIYDRSPFSASCGPSGCDVQNAMINRISAINQSGDPSGSLHLLKPVLRSLPYMGRQAVVIDEAGILSDGAGLKNLTIKGAAPLSVNQTAGATISGNDFILDASASSGLPNPGSPCPCYYTSSNLIESNFDNTYDSNIFETTLSGALYNYQELFQRNSAYNYVHNNTFGTSTGGWYAYGEGEIGGGNTYDGNTYWVWSCNRCIIPVGAVTVAGMNDTFTNNTINLPSGTPQDGSGGGVNLFQDGYHTGGDDVFNFIGNLTATGNTINNCAQTNTGGAGINCVLLAGTGTTFTGNTINHVGSLVTDISGNGGGTDTVSGNTLNGGFKGTGKSAKQL